MKRLAVTEAMGTHDGTLSFGSTVLAAYFFTVVFERSLRVRFSRLFLNARYQLLSLTSLVGRGTFLLLFHANSLPTAIDIVRPNRTGNCAFLHSRHGSAANPSVSKPGCSTRCLVLREALTPETWQRKHPEFNAEQHLMVYLVDRASVVVHGVEISRVQTKIGDDPILDVDADNRRDARVLLKGRIYRVRQARDDCGKCSSGTRTPGLESPMDSDVKMFDGERPYQPLKEPAPRRKKAVVGEAGAGNSRYGGSRVQFNGAAIHVPAHHTEILQEIDAHAGAESGVGGT